MSTKVLITGASGLLGRAVLHEFESDRKWSTLGLAFSRASGNLRKVDITDQQAVKDIMQEFKPDIVIHSAAERRPDVVDKQEEATYRLNVESTRSICQVAKSIGATIFYISTDYVFDGKNPPYRETDAPNPLNRYGVSKLEGEKVTLAESKGIPISKRVSKPTYKQAPLRTPQTLASCLTMSSDIQHIASDIAVVLKQLAEKKIQGQDTAGIFHWSGDEKMTKYSMAMAMAEAFSLPTNHIQADRNPSGGATRPYDAHLDCSRAQSLGIGQRTPFKSTIREILEPFYP
ncbi:hypothetical protein C0Q70_06078 [Pomacea canaliculata]|uniref:Methionine adenosyltransferase 2 subunit beta n=1 Tax=Pomacea canaliculata TaxID=400727 RepID=A0A2T7PN08_POMCA|nr:hypothetical protein C0Q70_06078 [Pomacea canaliculata]